MKGIVRIICFFCCSNFKLSITECMLPSGDRQEVTMTISCSVSVAPCWEKYTCNLLTFSNPWGRGETNSAFLYRHNAADACLSVSVAHILLGLGNINWIDSWSFCMMLQESQNDKFFKLVCSGPARYSRGPQRGGLVNVHICQLPVWGRNMCTANTRLLLLLCFAGF